MKPIVSCTEGVGAVKKRSQKAPVQKEVAAQASFPASEGTPQKKALTCPIGNQRKSLVLWHDEKCASNEKIPMTNNLELPQSQITGTSALMAFLSLSIALIAVSFAAIFIRWMELELGPNATIFNRLWIASLVLGGWTALNQQRGRLTDDTLTREKRSLTRRDFWLLIALSTVASTSLGFWAWSLTQTSVANSTVLRNLTPIFTCLGG